jgi:hypothetical protein
MIIAARRTRYTSQANELTLMANALGHVSRLPSNALFSKEYFSYTNTRFYFTYFVGLIYIRTRA